MTSTIIEKEDRYVIPFPKIMQNGDKTLIILFVEKESGTVIFTDKELYPVGEYRTDWHKENFSDWYGTIELSQRRDE
jgi:hypothetical protein